MTEPFSFARLEAGLARAAQEGVAEAASQFADVLRTNGEAASVQSAPDGTARIMLEGAATVAREFGTRNAPARPIIGAALQANRQSIRETIARKLTDAVRGARS
ncbi:MAG TPA: hypothetical protein VNH44_08785 [Micropepsaceae bacterium]|nr:hypothetical protein [Micropepsaceae bacterium]